MELVGLLRSRRFALAAFLIPLGIRALPEFMVGPYQIGWDTIAFYVPNTLDWATGKVGSLQMLGTAPLMYMISVPVYILTRVNPVWIFKIMGPVLYGTMMLALFRFLRIGLGWTSQQALGAALMTSLYFVTLRIGWDMYRNMLGLTFILLSLPLFANWTNPRNQLILSLLTVLSVASDQLTGVISLALIGARVLTATVEKHQGEQIRMLRIGLPGVILFFSIVYASLVVPGLGLVQTQSPVPTITSLGYSLGFLAFAYLFLTPLILLGLRKVSSFELKTWSIFCVLMVALALLPFFGPIVASYRWSLLLDLPLCVYASAGLVRLASFHRQSVGLARITHQHILPIVSTLLVISAVLYISLPAQQAMSYFTVFPGMLPTSMVQDTVPSSDMTSLRTMLAWVQVNIGPQTVLITHQAIYGWARSYLPATVHIVNYGYSGPLEGVSMAVSRGYTSIWMIWWINGSGWHGQPYVPTGFVRVNTDGSMAVYEYY